MHIQHKYKSVAKKFINHHSSNIKVHWLHKRKVYMALLRIKFITRKQWPRKLQRSNLNIHEDAAYTPQVHHYSNLFTYSDMCLFTNFMLTGSLEINQTLDSSGLNTKFIQYIKKRRKSSTALRNNGKDAWKYTY